MIPKHPKTIKRQDCRAKPGSFGRQVAYKISARKMYIAKLLLLLFAAGYYHINTAYSTTLVPESGQSKSDGIVVESDYVLTPPEQSNDQPRKSKTVSGIEEFLGSPHFSSQRLFDGRGGRSIVTAHDGTVLAFDGKYLRPSRDGGKTWGEPREIGHDASGTNVVLNELTGEILVVSPNGHMWKSSDHGQTFKREDIEILPDGFGFGSPDSVPLILWAMQSGIALEYGQNKGRLIMPGRILGPANSNNDEWRAYHYSTAIYSDDGGKTWQMSKPFPVLGTGEAALAEISDGSILYNSREHMSKGNRFIAWSHDGGDTWLDAHRSEYLPDGPRGSSYGCMGGLVRLPVDGYDILIYSNLDSESGEMPEAVGGTIETDRERITVWASFDGGKTWPVKRLVFEGPSAYSNLGVGRSGTPSEGMIYLLFEGGTDHMYSGVKVAVFNLGWLLDGRDLNEFLLRDDSK